MVSMNRADIENIARAIYNHVKSAGYPVSSVGLWETPTSHATYRG